MDDDLQSATIAGLTELRAQTTRLRAENARLLRLLELTPRQAAPPEPAQTGFFEAHPGPIHQRSAPETKVEFFATLFAARTDIHATRWENTHTGKAGWLPAVRGGFDGLIALQLGPIRHTITQATAPHAPTRTRHHRSAACFTCTRRPTTTSATPTPANPAAWPPSTATSSPTTPASPK